MQRQMRQAKRNEILYTNSLTNTLSQNKSWICTTFNRARATKGRIFPPGKRKTNSSYLNKNHFYSFHPSADDLASLIWPHPSAESGGGADNSPAADNAVVYWQLCNHLWRRDVYHEWKMLVISH